MNVRDLVFFYKYQISFLYLVHMPFLTCQVVDAIDEGVDAAVQNGGEVKDVTQDWVDLTEKARHILSFFF